MSEMNDILSKVGLTESEMQVYNAIIAFGMRTVGQVSAYTNMAMDEVQNYCQSLMDKSYLIKVESKMVKNEMGSLYIPLAPKISISGDISKRLSERLKSLSTKVTELWNDTQGIIDKDTEHLIKTVQDVLSENTKIVNKMSEDQQNSIIEWGIDVKDELNIITKEANNIFISEVTAPLVEISGSLNNLADQVNNLVDTSISEIQSKTDSHKTSIENAVREIKTELEEFSDEIGLLLMGRTAALNQSLENIASEKIEAADEIFNKVQTNINTVLNDEELRISTIDDELANTYMTAFDASKQILGDVVENIKNTFGETISKAVDTGKLAQKNAISGSTKLIEKYKEAQIGSVEDLQNSFLNSIKTVQTEAVTELSGLLGSTSKDLKQLEKNITDNLNKHQDTLDKDLQKLTKDVSDSLKIRFGEVEDKLAGFIGGINGENDGIIGSINEMRDFILNFLSEVNSDLSDHLDTLQDKVGNDIGDIVKSSNVSIAESLNENKEQINEISNKINENLDEFQDNISDLLSNVKKDIESKLIDAQSKFKEGVDEGVSSYRSESAKVAEIQKKQIAEIETESKNISEMANKSRNEINSLIESGLKSVKNENMDKFKTNINSNVEKFNRQFNSFNDSMTVDLNKFYENFQNKSTGLRENVPQEINTVFEDQIDRITKFKSDFERISNFIDQTFSKLESAFEPKSKVNLKKEKENYYQEVIRNKDEFIRLGGSISTHFSSSINDLDMTKNDLLEEVNKTIQDELEVLEELIGNKTRETSDMMSEFKNKLDSNKNNFIDEVNTQTSDTMRTIEASITKQLLSIFQQPLDSILSKARSVATGTEGMEQENRLIKTQNDLVSSIQDAVGVLVDTLQSAFETSISELDSKVSDSIDTSQKIVKDLKNELASEFGKQNSNADSFAASLNDSIGNVEKSLKDNLQDTLVNTKNTVKETVNQKNDEISNTVSESTEGLKASFENFKNEFNQIGEDTSASIESTVKTAVDEQKNSMGETVGTLSETTKLATDSIANTQNSLKDKVGTPLASIEKDVKEMINTFNKSTENAKKMIGKEIKDYYSETTDHLNAISDMNKEIIASSKQFMDEINSIQNSQKDTILAQTGEFKQKREVSVATFKEALQKEGEDLTANNHEFIEESFSQMAEQLSMLQQEVLSSIENVKGEIDLKVTNAVETVRSDILGPANEVVNALMLEKDNVNERSRGLATKFAELESSQHSVIGDSENKFKASIEKTIDKELDKWKVKAGKSYGKQADKFDVLASEFANKVSSESSDGKQKVTDAFNTIPDTIDETLAASAESMKLLNELSKGSIKLEPKFPELSYFDATAEAVKANLNSVLMNTKSNATIISPTLEWLDLDLLDKWSRASVRIVTDPTQHTAEDEKIVQAIKDSDSNISLRKHDKNRYRGEIDLIMVSRDREEIVMAKLLTEKYPYAFVTQDEAFIEKFRVLFADFATMPEM